MTRTSMVTLAVVLVALVVGIGYYASYEPTGGQIAQCTDSFNRLDAASNDMQLDYSEFQTYQAGISPEEFARADADGNKAVTLQEFCSWSGAGTEKG